MSRSSSQPATGKGLGLGSSPAERHLPPILSQRGREHPSSRLPGPSTLWCSLTLTLLCTASWALRSSCVSHFIPTPAFMLTTSLEQPISGSLRAYPIHHQRQDNEEGPAGFGSKMFPAGLAPLDLALKGLIEHDLPGLVLGLASFFCPLLDPLPLDFTSCV